MEPHDQEQSEQPRQPRNLQDVLRYAIEAGNNTEPQQSEPQFSPLDPTRRRFLEEAIHSLTVDVVRILKEAIETLKGLSKETLSPETYESALDEIAEHVDNMDAANDYVKLGGFNIVDNCLNSQHPGIRWRIADIIAQCTQNNPFCQNHALNLRLLEPLIIMVDKDPDEQCKTKAVFAISNIVRDSTVGLKEFMRLNGFSAVKKAMKSNTEKLRIKATFFFNSVVSNQPSVIYYSSDEEIIREFLLWQRRPCTVKPRVQYFSTLDDHNFFVRFRLTKITVLEVLTLIEGDVVSMGFPELLTSLLKDAPGPCHEFVASSLLFLAQNSKEALATCKKPDLKLIETLTRIVGDHKTDDCYTELVESSQQLLALVR